MRSYIIAAATASIFLSSVSGGYAQTHNSASAVAPPTAADFAALTDARLSLIKAALQITPEQEKYWPAVENAVRARSAQRLQRLQEATERLSDIREHGLAASLLVRDPVAFLNRRSEALASRAAATKTLAAAWQPLYATLNEEQKKRLGFLTLYALREMRDAAENRQVEIWEEDEEE
jgi:hypothetical protein